MQQIQQCINQGEALSAALKQHPKFFDQLTCDLLIAGEKSGNVAQMLQHAANYRQRNATLKQQIRSALLYPIIVLTIAAVVTLILMMVVIPQFEQLFTDNRIALPLLTEKMIELSQQLKKHQLSVFILPILMITIFNFAKQRNRYLNRWCDQLLLRTPVIGEVVKKIITVRCLETLAITFSAGIPILDCLTMSANVANHSSFHHAFIVMRHEVEKGSSLHRAMQQITLFPPVAVAMVACGERSGQLDRLINHLTTLYRQQIDQYIANLDTLLEPIIMVILGGVIGLILVAIYLPIFQLGKVI